LADASRFIEVIENRQGVQVACLEEIAWRKGWISDDDLLRLAESMKNNPYGEYMIKLVKR
jgi:glucose-1-phosphate thymidylyltransferase